MKKANRDTDLRGQGTSIHDSVKLKRKASSVPPKDTTPQSQGDDFPNPETLALIAANTVKLDGRKTPREVVEHAYSLLVEARELIGRQRKMREDSERWKIERRVFPQPRKFPATLDDFLRIIVRGRSRAESEKRFREFLEFSIYFERKSLSDAGEKIKSSLKSDVEYAYQRTKREGWDCFTAWWQSVNEYRKYWQSHLSYQARASAKRKQPQK